MLRLPLRKLVSLLAGLSLAAACTDSNTVTGNVAAGAAKDTAAGEVGDAEFGHEIKGDSLQPDASAAPDGIVAGLDVEVLDGDSDAEPGEEVQPFDTETSVSAPETMDQETTIVADPDPGDVVDVVDVDAGAEVDGDTNMPKDIPLLSDTLDGDGQDSTDGAPDGVEDTDTAIETQGAEDLDVGSDWQLTDLTNEIDVSPVCLAGAATCIEGTPANCGVDGLAWIPSLPCMTGFACLAGECKKQICVPALPFCEGAVAKLCSESGLDLAAAPTDCAALGKICLSGNCAPNPCGNGVLDSNEQCDDGNSVSGDGCSVTCTSEWQVLMTQDFSAAAPGWTPCAGCSAGGCPSAKTGAIACAADWTRVCMPIPDYTNNFKRIRLQFTVHAEVPMSAFWIASGPLDGWNDQTPRIGFDGVGGGVTLSGKNANTVGLMDFLPVMPFTAQLAIELELATGKVWVQKVGEPLTFLGTVDVISPGPWVWNMATNYACCNGSLAASWFDDFSFSGVPK